MHTVALTVVCTLPSQSTYSSMGASVSLITPQQLEQFVSQSFFTRSEIRKVLSQFDKLTADKKGSSPLQKTLTLQEFMDTSELKYNPFKHRIAAVFSAGQKKKEVGFADYLDFMSVMSEEATRDVKTYYAFQIYDFDEDGYIGKKDLLKCVQLLVGTELTTTEIDTVVAKTFAEADMDGDDKLSFVEFEHVLSRASDFTKYVLYFNVILTSSTFRIRV